jgi:hypothetical protein
VTNARDKIVYVLPDRRHAVAETKKASEAVCAECAECGAEFDNNVTFFRSVSQKTYFHARGAGHTRFVYYTIIEMKQFYVVIPCGSAKRDRLCSADELYTGSYHLACKTYALSIAPRQNVLILSALHGLVALDQPLAPYNLKMGERGCVSPQTVREQARERGLLEAQVVAVGGEKYLRVVREVWPGVILPVGVRGGMGAQMQALKGMRGRLPHSLR